MPLRPLILVAALAAVAVPAFAQDQAERDRMAALRAVGEAERTAQDAQRQQMEQANQQRELQARVEALEAQRQNETALRPAQIPNTSQARIEDLRQLDVDARLSAIERQQQANQAALRAAQSASASTPVPAPTASLPKISPFSNPQPSYGMATNAQKQAAADAYTACLTGAARRMDDHISDAATIAVAIQPGCFSQFGAWKESLERGTVGGLRITLEQALELSQQTGAVQAVLQVRQQTRAAR